MSENILKVAHSASPARSGGGDFPARRLAHELCRYPACATPPPRMPGMNPKKLFSTPVSKFTARRLAPSPSAGRLRACLAEYRAAAALTPVKPKTRIKASSMEDLTPSKRVKKDSEESSGQEVCVARSARKLGVSEAQAAARISRFMLVAAWRRRKDEILNLRRTLDSKRVCSERLRVQVFVLKSLLESDNARVVLAMRELERLKQLLQDKDLERALLEREKLALEKDVSIAEDRASELSIGWRNTRNELDASRASEQRLERERDAERAARDDARTQRDHAYARLNLLEEELAQHEALLTSAEAEVEATRREADDRGRLLKLTTERLRSEQEARACSSSECSELRARCAELSREVEEVHARLAAREAELRRVAERLAWWPRPLTDMLGAARSWLRQPLSLPEALVWTLIPARHGC